MKREIIRVDEEKCNGCGLCIPNCPEGALRIVSGKARLVRDLLCDGLGACLGHCPEGAIIVEERDAEAYDETSVIANIVPQGRDTIETHLTHLREHNQQEYLRQAIGYLEGHGIAISRREEELGFPPSLDRTAGCPGLQSSSFNSRDRSANEVGSRASRLTHWPIQLHLINPKAPHFAGSDLLLAADCVAYAVGDFHEDHLKGKCLAIACPKLDDGQDAYLAKLTALIDSAGIGSLTVMIMQVPCCSGLLHLARRAADQASRKIPIRHLVIGVRGEILHSSL